MGSSWISALKLECEGFDAKFGTRGAIVSKPTSASLQNPMAQ